MSVTFPAWMKSREMPAMGFDMPSPESVWRVLGPPTYTCVFPAGYVPEPAAVRFLHTFAPGAILMLRRQSFLPPNQKNHITAVHWAIGWHVWNPHSTLRLFHVDMPEGALHPRPNLLDTVAIAERRGDGGPDGYQPFNMEYVSKLRRDFYHGTGKMLFDRIESGQQRAYEDAIRKRAEDAAYKEKQLEPLDRRARELTKYDWDRYYAKALEAKAKPWVYVTTKGNA